MSDEGETNPGERRRVPLAAELPLWLEQGGFRFLIVTFRLQQAKHSRFFCAYCGAMSVTNSQSLETELRLACRPHVLRALANDPSYMEPWQWPEAEIFNISGLLRVYGRFVVKSK